ncbi:hypothetical protein B296_00036825 [Ensete ventricosum]|uniref:Uncharacterized protein n=1 Tax=Ensete ventricosum TaxID=4639 RepID=A0A426XC68_ENSVE|nr:hypothetical protein B296_00036825 [Ensete ventricosum]
MGTTGNNSWQRGARKVLPLAGAAVPAIGVAAPWQGDCQRARVAVACAGATATAQRGKRASIFLVYYRAYVHVIICNYMERHGGSMEVITRPTMSWREITTYGDAIIRRNQ